MVVVRKYYICLLVRLLLIHLPLMEILGTFDCPLIQEKLKFFINLFILAKLLDLAKDLEADFFR